MALQVKNVLKYVDSSRRERPPLTWKRQFETETTTKDFSLNELKKNMLQIFLEFYGYSPMTYTIYSTNDV